MLKGAVKIKKITVADRISVLSSALALIYTIIYAVFIFPSVTLGQLEVQTDSAVGAVVAVFGSAVGVVVAAVIISLGAVLLLISDLIIALLLRQSRKSLSVPGKSKKSAVFLSVSVFLQLVILTFSILMASGQSALYIPACALSAVGTLSMAVSVFFRVRYNRNKSEGEQL